MIEDITELKKKEIEKKEMEERIRWADKLVSIGQLAAGLAHEINNPLAIIKGNAYYVQNKLHKLLSKKSKEGDINEYAEILGMIIEETARCEKIISGLLQFARKDRRKASLMDINEEIVNTLAITEHNLLLNKIKVIKKLSSNVPKIMGNGSQLRQVFINMILNAQHAMPKGRRLIVETLYNGCNKNVEIKFIDRGHGIPKENLNKVFDPFFTTKAPSKGVGLGLSMSHGIITAHKGTIEVESRPGKGTIFTIRLPVIGKKQDCAKSKSRKRKS